MKETQILNNDSSSEVMDLFSLFNLFWKHKLLIIFITASFALASVLYSLSIPNTYTSKGLVAHFDNNSSGSINSSGLSSLAQFAGISVKGGSGDRSELAMEIVKSRKFIENFVQKYNLLVPLMAANDWDRATRKLIINPAIYDEEAKTWISKRPSSVQVYNHFSSILSISKSKITGFITISIEYFSPDLAKEWIDLIIADINIAMKEQDLKEAESAVSYLQDKLSITRLQSMKEVLSRVMQSQIQVVMLAEVKEEYMLQTIDPAFVPEQKTKPNRAFICLVGTLIGGILSLIIVLIVSFLNSLKEE